MKRIAKDKNFSKSYYPIVAWQEDLQDIYDVLKSGGGDVTISNDDYQFDSIADAVEHFGKRSQFALKLTTLKPYSYVELTRMWNRIYVSSGPTSAQLYHELDELMIKLQRKPALLHSYWFVWPLIIVQFGLSWLGNENRIVFWMSLVVDLIFVWFLWVSFLNLRRSAVIRFQRRSEAEPFLERNRDRLLMMVISAIFGGAVALIGAKVKDQYFSPSPPVVSPKQ